MARSSACGQVQVWSIAQRRLVQRGVTRQAIAPSSRVVRQHQTELHALLPESVIAADARHAARDLGELHVGVGMTTAPL